MRPMSMKKYREYLAKRTGKPIKRRSVAGKWSVPEKRYFTEILNCHGKYIGDNHDNRMEIVSLGKEKHFYTPDFVTYPEGSPTRVYHEVKGAYRLQSQDAARLRWLMAANKYGGFGFVWAKLRKDGLWDMDYSHLGKMESLKGVKGSEIKWRLY